MKVVGHKIIGIFAAAMVSILVLAGCGGTGASAPDPGIEDGTYVATFTTDNSMFHVSEANDDRGILTVENGEMTIHVSLQSKKIVNLYYGKAEDASKDGAELIEPTVDHVVYSDGYEEDVYGFDIPVPALDEEYDVALIGTKGNWYDHKVVVSDPVPGDDIHATADAAESQSGTSVHDLEDGEHTVAVTLEGGSGKATIESPTPVRVDNGTVVLTVTWSSPHYDYMIVDGERYEPVNTEGNSVFEIPVQSLDEPLPLIADTTAMSQPHEIEYTITFDTSSIS